MGRHHNVVGELRVHGVSGTPPRDMLYTDPTQVRFQGTEPHARTYEIPPSQSTPDQPLRVDGFHWGGLTAGAARTAYWILLAPFALANTAGWMTRGSEPRSRAAQIMVRMAGLTLTGIFATQLVTALVLSIRLWSRDADMTTGWTRLLIAGGTTIALAAVTLVVAWFAMRSHSDSRSLKSRLGYLLTVNNENLLRQEDTAGSAPPGFDLTAEERVDLANRQWADPAKNATLDDPQMWYEAVFLTRLTRIHVSFAFAVIAWVTALVIEYRTLEWLALAFIASCGIAVLRAGASTSRDDMIAKATAILPLATLALGVVTALATFNTNPDGWDLYAVHRATLYVGIGFVVFAAGSAIGGLHVAGALALAGQSGAVLGVLMGYTIQALVGIKASDPLSLQENGAEWVAVALLAEIVAIALVATCPFVGLAFRSADVAGIDSVRIDDYPKGILRWFVYGRRIETRARRILEVAAVVGVAAVVIAFVGFLNSGAQPSTCPEGMNPCALPRPRDLGLTATSLAIATALSAVGLVVMAIKAMRWTIIKAAAVLVGAFVVLRVLSADSFRVAFGGVEVSIRRLPDIALAVAILIPGGFMLNSIIRGLTGGEEARRQVGILWDLTTFWPRWFQPLGPPSYGPRVVRVLRHRFASGLPPNRIPPDFDVDVVGAHSQGSLITMVALDRFTTEAARKEEINVPKGFITYGSQLGWLYRELFPNVGIQDLCSRLGSHASLEWINVWRQTDPIGGHVIPELEDRNWHDADPNADGHSRYERSGTYSLARAWTLTDEPDLESVAVAEAKRLYETGLVDRALAVARAGAAGLPDSETLAGLVNRLATLQSLEPNGDLVEVTTTLSTRAPAPPVFPS
ncbi:MAG: hypothetical protein OEW30_09500 [Acidimicrobiia bacterium]|nr:hypothetical protein [Acidimicrobiia bacterium]MDH5294443.1 hypothetical protein [Acidimicrobiia bacterium]